MRETLFCCSNFSYKSLMHFRVVKETFFKSGKQSKNRYLFYAFSNKEKKVENCFLLAIADIGNGSDKVRIGKCLYFNRVSQQ